MKYELKNPNDIHECKKGLHISLNLKDGNTYHGIFNGIDEDDDNEIMLKSTCSNTVLGFKKIWVSSYLEEVK